MIHKVSNLTQTIKDEADRMQVSPEHKTKALELFLEGYEEHKSIFGSYATITNGIEYNQKMAVRYDYMFNKAFSYIQDIAEGKRLDYA